MSWRDCKPDPVEIPILPEEISEESTDLTATQPKPRAKRKIVMTQPSDNFNTAIVPSKDIESNMLELVTVAEPDMNDSGTSYKKFAISDVMDQDIWEALNDSTKNNITTVVLAKLKPDGIENSLWVELSHFDKLNIINSKLSSRAQCGRPDEVSSKTWSKFSTRTKIEVHGKLHCLRPPGFDLDLWKGLGEQTQRHVSNDLIRHSSRSRVEMRMEYKKSSYCCLPFQIYHWITQEPPGDNLLAKQGHLRWWLQRVTIKSRILTFFAMQSHIIEDPDTGIGAMVLVCALILTIPFGAFSYLNDNYLTALQNSLLKCDNAKSFSGQNFESIKNLINKSLSACIFCSIMGLILSSVYYVFKPLPGKDLELWCRNQGRILIASLFIVTALDIAGLMALGYCLLGYSSVQLANICTYDSSPIFKSGVYGVIVSFVVAVGCML
jgi:hypothetical protein